MHVHKKWSLITLLLDIVEGIPPPHPPTQTHTHTHVHACAQEGVSALLLDIVEGMEFIHTKNIIHGDLKPENVLLAADQNSPVQMVAKITGVCVYVYVVVCMCVCVCVCVCVCAPVNACLYLHGSFCLPE